MAATGHWARWERTWVSGTSPSGAGVSGVVMHGAVCAGEEVGVGGGGGPGVSPVSCLHCHPPLGPEPTGATSH